MMIKTIFISLLLTFGLFAQGESFGAISSTHPISREFYLEIVRGNVPGHSIVHKFGYNDGVTTSFSPITKGGIYPTPTSAVSLEFISDDAADAQDDIGMHELTVIGLDASWNEQTVVTSAHATDGLTAVAISGTWLRVYRAFVSSSGSYASATLGSHQGDVTVRVSGGGSTYLTISSTDFSESQSEIGVYSVPIGYTGYILSAHANVDANKVGTLLLFRRDNADDVTSPYSGTMRLLQRFGGVVGPVPLDPKSPINGLVGPCDVGFMGKVSVGTGEIDIDFEILLIEDGY